MKRLPIMHAVALHADSQRTDLTGGLAGQLVDESWMKPNAKAGAAAAGGGHTQRSRSRRHSGTGTHTCMHAPGRPPSDDQTTRPLHETWAGRSS